MAGLQQSMAGRAVSRFARFGLLRGLRSIEINRDQFRRQLATRYGLDVSDFRQLRFVPVERLDAVAKALIRDAERLAALEGAGFGLGGMITIIPDAGILTVLTLRLIQKLCLLYGFDQATDDDRLDLWLAAAAATGLDFGKDLAEKQLVEKLGPRIAERLAIKIGQESAEKWVGRLIPLASSVIGGALNFAFVRGWARRVQRNLRKRHIEMRTIPMVPPGPAYRPTHPLLV